MATGLPLGDDALQPTVPGAKLRGLLPPAPVVGPGFQTLDFSGTPTQTRKNYSLRLGTSSETMRSAAVAAAAQVATISGVRITVEAGTIPDREPTKGEIVLSVESSPPCGVTAAACAIPRLVTTTPAGINKINGGRIWIKSFVTSYTPTDIQFVVSHELGHALGLDHFDSDYAGQTQVMNSGTTAAGSGPAYATGGIFRLGDQNGLRFLSPPPSQFELRNANTTGGPNLSFGFGDPGDIPLKGDWDGDGIDTPGTFRPATATWYLRNSNTPGTADIAFVYGSPGDTPVVGDWNGDGTDTIGVHRGHIWYLRNSNTPGTADLGFGYGDPTDTPVVGDWNGDGTDTIGVHRGNNWYLRNTNSSGAADIGFGYGDPGDSPVVGDWNGDGTDTIGVHRGSMWYLRNSNSPGAGDVAVEYGEAQDTPLPGDWNSNGTDTVGVHR